MMMTTITNSLSSSKCRNANFFNTIIPRLASNHAIRILQVSHITGFCMYSLVFHSLTLVE